MTDARATISFKIRAAFSKGREKMARQAKEEGSKQVRLINGKDVGIHVYTVKAPNGIVMEYVNESSHYKLMESIGFEMQNCRIEGQRGSQIKITLTPGETEVFKIVPVDAYAEWNARTKSCKYAVVDAQSDFGFN